MALGIYSKLEIKEMGNLSIAKYRDLISSVKSSY